VVAQKARSGQGHATITSRSLNFDSTCRLQVLSPPAGTDGCGHEAEAAAALIDAVLAREPIAALPALSGQQEPQCMAASSFQGQQGPGPEQSTAARCQRQHPGVSLEWRNLSYCVPSPTGPRALLRGVWGYVQGGEMMALMGASGAGTAVHACMRISVCMRAHERVCAWVSVRASFFECTFACVCVWCSSCLCACVNSEVPRVCSMHFAALSRHGFTRWRSYA